MAEAGVERGVMLGREGGYAAATRHPWPCLVFLMPLLLAYEGGLFWYGGQQTEVLRNGADTWLHSGLTALGLWRHTGRRS